MQSPRQDNGRRASLTELVAAGFLFTEKLPL